MAEKVGILVVKNIKCTLNQNVIAINQWRTFLPFLPQREIYLTVQYGDNERSTKPARLENCQDGRKEAYYTESITLPIVKVAQEFKVTCYVGNDVDAIWGDTRDTLRDSLNENESPGNDVGNGRKENVGGVTLYLMFLAMEAPKKRMRQLKALCGQMIGIMIIDNIKVKNLNGRKGCLRVMLGNEKASTEKYFNIVDKECPYGIILPVVASPNFSMLLQIYYSTTEFGSHRIFFSSQHEDLWIKLMYGGQVSGLFQYNNN
ncbi:3703_t:CDS:2 [Diversispora eburnea]|uniref:3703_t:CDS:1 n=1 Tax=Diversispora eburnea TaxID=1213867 RepID=A0A9N9BKX0_9GLOM|nr:3703_t:CDS:2 [Diversispora eburnea]